MFFWKKKVAEVEQEISQIEELKAFRQVGGEFNFLGRRCVVMTHADWVPGYGGGYGRPRLIARYADNDGVLHEIVFDHEELPALRAQNLAAWE